MENSEDKRVLVFFQRWGLHILIIIAVFVIISALVWTKAGDIYILSIALSVCALFFWFLYIVTGELTDRKIGLFVLFCYVFSIFLLMGSILPLMAVSTDSWFYKKMLNRPINLVLGCSIESKKSSEKGFSGSPDEVECANGGEQWFLNIGGEVINPTVLKYKITLGSIGKYTRRQFPPNLIDKLETILDNEYLGQADFLKALKNLIDNKELYNEHKDKILKYAKSSKGNSKIFGGLVVPIYLVVLAFLGASINMILRVSEYQRQTVDNDKSRSENEKMKEILILQIMQVVSAPIFAITAFYLIAPSSTATTVVIGFVAGFFSETILYLLRLPLAFLSYHLDKTLIRHS